MSLIHLRWEVWPLCLSVEEKQVGVTSMSFRKENLCLSVQFKKVWPLCLSV